MNKKGFVNTMVVIIVVVILACVVGYFAFNQKNVILVPVNSSSPNPDLTPSPSLTPTPSPSQAPKDNIFSVSLGQQFTLKKGQIAKIENTGLEIEITAFYNSPCPVGVQCIWSGVGIGFEYHNNGEMQNGINLLDVFGYETTIVKTDHETYANLIIEKKK